MVSSTEAMVSEGNAGNPDQVTSNDDPGDETARRYRYQWTYAAIVACMLLDDTEDVTEIFCEHHEDVLVKHEDGLFSGLQVKTRDTDQPVWKTGDVEVRNACARFTRLESQFPGSFRRFRFLTNHPLHAAGNGQDLQFVLTAIANASTIADLAGPVERFLLKVANQAGVSDDVAFSALGKAHASHDLPKKTDVGVRLIDALSQVWPRAAECSFSAVSRAARALVDACGRASSLAHADVLPAYVPASADPERTRLRERLLGKTINREDLLSLLETGLAGGDLLEGDPEDLDSPGKGTASLLRMKLDAGGFSVVSLNSAEDLRNKADYLGLKWTSKYGQTTGLQRYGHVRSLVLHDAAKAFETTKTEDGRFGLAMLDELREHLARRRTDGAETFDCSQEHLEGFAYSLTSECRIVWSTERPWEEEG
jgi:hypothetical protein